MAKQTKRKFRAYALVPAPAGKIFLGDFESPGLSNYVAWNKAAKLYPDWRDELYILPIDPPGEPFRPNQLETEI